MNCHYGREEPDGENMVLIAAVAGGHKQYIPIWAGTFWSWSRSYYRLYECAWIIRILILIAFCIILKSYIGVQKNISHWNSKRLWTCVL